ncbi:ABC-2 type transport system permease protein [Bacilli bacterium PM5-3]|nr:ABC-2 type transport system permease protein [Bacilli bacterium PM5-3]
MGRFFVYQIKSIIREKILVFWSLVFPIILVSLFNLAFSNVDSSKLFEPFNVGVVGDKNAQVIKILKEIEFNDEKTFILEYLSEAKAYELLENKEISGIVKVEKDDNVDLIVNEVGSEQLMLQEVLNSYQQKSNMIKDELKNNPELYQSDWLNKLEINKDYVKEKPISEKSVNSMNLCYYSVIAMACLFGAFISADGIRLIQPNLSNQGARVNLSPFSKGKMLFSNFFACLLVTLCSSFLLIVYMKYVIKIDFGDQYKYIALIVLIGSLFSISFGYIISLLVKKSEGSRVGIIISTTMVGSFLAGMMSKDIKVMVEQALPIIKYFNPVALITDSFYTIYYYDDFTMIYPYLAVISIMCVACLAVSIILLRRTQYDSI